MVQSDYPRAAMKRLTLAIEALDERSRDVLAYHLAIEREMDVALAALLPRADCLWKFEYGRRLSFGQKVSVLQATSSITWIDLVAQSLMDFNELRNAVAHGRAKTKIDKAFGKVCASVYAMGPRGKPTGKETVGALALSICGALAVDTDERMESPISHH